MFRPSGFWDISRLTKRKSEKFNQIAAIRHRSQHFSLAITVFHPHSSQHCFLESAVSHCTNVSGYIHHFVTFNMYQFDIKERGKSVFSLNKVCNHSQKLIRFFKMTQTPARVIKSIVKARVDENVCYVQLTFSLEDDVSNFRLNPGKEMNCYKSLVANALLYITERLRKKFITSGGIHDG